MNTLCLLILLTLFSLSFSKEKLCNPQDKKVLLQIKKDFGNPYDLASWLSQDDCCGWYSVDCDDTGRVTSISISGEPSGHIPPSVGDLPYLQYLTIRKAPNVTGPIQPAISKLKNLKSLWLSWNNLTGPIPEFLGQLKNLEYINLSFNKLSGTIPGSLSVLPKLDAIFLDRNQLTGSIPESFGSLKAKHVYLVLAHNQLSGKIPQSLGKADFDKVDLSRNRLEGDASMFFGLNKSIQTVDLSRNLLEFDFSKLVFPPSSLISLDISHNKIYGSIPAQVKQVDLQQFNVSYNRLCGKIPSGGKLRGFDYTAYFHNKCLCGTPLPSCK